MRHQACQNAHYQLEGLEKLGKSAVPLLQSLEKNPLYKQVPNRHFKNFAVILVGDKKFSSTFRFNQFIIIAKNKIFSVPNNVLGGHKHKVNS